MKRVLLTGGSGFIGSNLARRLLRDGHQVHLLLRPDHRPWRIAPILGSVTPHQVELHDAAAIRAVVRLVRPHWVFHLAAYGAYAAQDDLDLAVRTNFLATIELVRASLDAGCESFVNSGSSSEYGFKDHPTAETDLPEPNSWYAVTKVSSTLFCRYLAQREHRNVTTLRIYSAFGPYEEPTRLMPALIVEGLDGRLPPLVDPSIARDYVYVGDVCDAYVAAASRPPDLPGDVYNVATGVQTPLRHLVAIARRVLGISAEPVWRSMSDRAWDTASWVGDPRHIERELGWRPTHDLESGFREMVQWFSTEPPWLETYRKARRASGSSDGAGSGGAGRASH